MNREKKNNKSLIKLTFLILFVPPNYQPPYSRSYYYIVFFFLFVIILYEYVLSMHGRVSSSGYYNREMNEIHVKILRVSESE